MNEFSRVDSLDLFDEFVYEDKTLIVYDKTPTKTLAYEQITRISNTASRTMSQFPKAIFVGFMTTK